LFGASSADVIGRTSYRSDINKDQAEFLRDADLRVFESRKEQNIPQELVSTASEGVKIMHTVKTPVFNSDGTPNCLLMVSEDITAKTKMEKQIREAGDKNTLLIGKRPRRFYDFGRRQNHVRKPRFLPPPGL